MTIIIFLVILALLVLSHEFGHFSVAKFFGIRVDEFGFGFPPRLFSWKRGETIYSINLLPFGGFVKIFGEDPTTEILNSDHKDAPRSLYRKPRYIQAAVIVAGIVFNLILAFAVMSAGFMYGLPVPEGFSSLGPNPADSRLLVTGILKGSPAERSGLRSGDNLVFLSTKDQTLDNTNIDDVQKFIMSHEGEQIFIGYKESADDGILATTGMGPLEFKQETKTAIVIPEKGVIGDKPGIGISMGMVGILKLSFLDAIYAGFVSTISLFTGTISGLWHFVTSFLAGMSSGASVSGPIGLIGIVGEAAHSGIAYLLALTALISVNLAVLNLMPFPALDGGRLFFLLVESIIRKPLNPKVVNTVNIAGFLFLLGLMLVVTYGDILKLIKY